MSSRLRHPSMGRRSAESKLTILASAADHSLAYFAPTDSTSKTVATSQFGCNVPEFEVLTGPSGSGESSFEPRRGNYNARRYFGSVGRHYVRHDCYGFCYGFAPLSVVDAAINPVQSAWLDLRTRFVPNDPATIRGYTHADALRRQRLTSASESRSPCRSAERAR